jgi:opacity protein-like surface antigen
MCRNRSGFAGVFAVCMLGIFVLEGCKQLEEIKSPGLGGQVAFRGGYAHLDSGRGGEVFTDTLGLAGENDDSDGFNVGASLDVPLLNDGFGNTLLGDISLDYHQFSHKKVLQVTDVITDAVGATPAPGAESKITVNEMTIAVSPKYRLDSMGKLRPWVIPAGLAFLVSSPPSDDTTYLDVGMQFGAGAEYMLTDWLSAGADVRYTVGFGAASVENDVFTVGGYLGLNF